MTDRKTLQLRDLSETDAAPALRKKGRGWEISARRLDALRQLGMRAWFWGARPHPNPSPQGEGL